MKNKLIKWIKEHPIRSGAIFFIIITITPLLISIFAKDQSWAGQLGDTFGGLTAPFINFLAAILVYVSFNEQRKANKNQWEAINEERRTIENDRKLELIIKYFNQEIKDKSSLQKKHIYNEFDSFYKDLRPEFYTIYSKPTLQRSGIERFFRYLNLYNYCLHELITLEIDLSLKLFLVIGIIEDYESHLRTLETIMNNPTKGDITRMEILKSFYPLLYEELDRFNKLINEIKVLYNKL